ncbi:MAG: hypothetical protein K2R98_05055 [Gemmataceae bacterium]|nr:hypothetical protein [Gemmataceae bacterium]
MKRWPWSFFFCSALVGCERPSASLPVPPIDLAAPTEVETATFALG